MSTFSLLDHNGNAMVDSNGNMVVEYNGPGPAQYMLLRSHYIGGAELPPGTIITEGIDVLSNWIPTLAVDPLNTAAVNDFWAAGPKDNGQESLNWWADTARIKPVTYWTTFGSPISYWNLTGLGAALPWLPIGNAGDGYKVLMTEDGRPIMTESGQEIIVP